MSSLVNADTRSSLWIDVRTPEEYEEGNIEGHINIPYQLIEERIGALNLEKNQEINLYCKSGRRAGIALEKLESLGFSHVTNLGSFNSAQEAWGLMKEGE